MKPNVIAHLDMDAFFAAVEQRDNPEIKGKPVVVGANPKNGKGRGVVSTCSYEARTFGVRSAMPISEAYRRCPHAIFLPVNGSKYREVSDQIFDILYDFTPDIEPVSIDEAFLDITGTYHFHKTPINTCLKIKEAILRETQLKASIGIAPVKFVAKIASDYCKPDGLLEISDSKLFDFLWPLGVERLWGVGQKTKNTLNTLGIMTIGQIAQMPLEQICELLGEHGHHLHDLAQGVDGRGISAEEEAKSISNEHTFERDISDINEINSVLLYLSEKVSRRMRKNDFKAKTLTLKIRLKGFKTYSRAHTFPSRTNFTEDIYQQAKILINEFYRTSSEFRLIGVRMSSFKEQYVQDSLFTSKEHHRLEKMHQALDIIKDKFGDNAIHRGSP